MRNLTTDDIRKMLGEGSMYYGKKVSELSDDEVVQCFGTILMTGYNHAYSKHYSSIYSSIMDEPRY